MLRWLEPAAELALKAGATGLVGSFGFNGRKMMIGRILSTLYNSSPKEIAQRIRRKLSAFKSSIHGQEANQESPAMRAELQRRFEHYQTPNLCSISAADFAQHIHSSIGKVDAECEGYSDSELEQQRDLSIKFRWGHHHDFGDFSVEGRMRDRHISLMTYFLTLFPVSLEGFDDKDVFDVGCWTGGTTLLLSSLGSRVFAIEEVKKYADMTSFLLRSFGLEGQAAVQSLSIYDCNSEEFSERFDIVHFPGVVYHLSDPLLALRILFNSLKVGGFILVESAGINLQEPFCRFDGSLITHSGERKRLNRGGWNWYIPSPSALYRMMREAGFDEIETLWHHKTNRVYGYGKKKAQVGICKAGLSVPSIR